MYSERVRELISTLPNSGILAEATHRSRSENPVCGDITQLYLKIEGDFVQDCRFQTYGCPGAIAAAAAITLLCKGRTVADCRRLTLSSLLDYLQGLPSHKIHGGELAIACLKEALESV